MSHSRERENRSALFTRGEWVYWKDQLLTLLSSPSPTCYTHIPCNVYRHHALSLYSHSHHVKSNSIPSLHYTTPHFLPPSSRGLCPNPLNFKRRERCYSTYRKLSSFAQVAIGAHAVLWWNRSHGGCSFPLALTLSAP